MSRSKCNDVSSYSQNSFLPRANNNNNISSSNLMKFPSSYMLALAALLLVITMLLTNAYVVPRSGMRITSTGGLFAPRVSYGYAIQQQHQFSPMRTRTAASMTAPAKNKNAAQRMFDFYCSLVWIARPDLFLYDRLARMAWDSLTKNLQKIEADNAPENVVNKALREMQVRDIVNSRLLFFPPYEVIFSAQ